MSHQPDDRPPDETPGGAQQPGRPLDEDAAWAQIVANYGERPEMGADETVLDDSRGRRTSGTADLFDHTYLDAQLQRAAQEDAERDGPRPWDDEGHFVPPPPPPLPVVDPRRKVAWFGLFGSPLLMLIGVVLGWTYPTWVSFLLVVAFVGGFGYLVATMSRRGADGSGGDDGAVV